MQSQEASDPGIVILKSTILCSKIITIMNAIEILLFTRSVVCDHIQQKVLLGKTFWFIFTLLSSN